MIVRREFQWGNRWVAVAELFKDDSPLRRPGVDPITDSNRYLCDRSARSREEAVFAREEVGIRNLVKLAHGEGAISQHEAAELLT